MAPYLITFIVAVISLFLSVAVSWLKQKVKSEQANNAIDIVTDAVYDVVHHMEQTVRPMLSDGKLDDQEKQIIKQKALGRLKEGLSPQVLKALQMVTADVEKFLESKLESTVYRLKKGVTL